MRPLLAAAIAALIVPTALAGSRAYTDSVCRADGVAWTNDRCAGRQWGLTAIDAPEAWRTTRHPDLRGRLLRVPGSNLLKNTAARCPWQPRAPGRRSRALAQDDNGHGTHVAGTIAAASGNLIGVAGVAPRARVLPVKVLDRKGSGSERDVARGICFAVKHGANVINMSLGDDPVSSIFIRGSKEGEDTNRAVAYAYARGVSVLIAAGNETFPACDFPASHTKALCVGAVDRRGFKATYSNFGVSIGVVAPGGAGGGLGCDSDEDVWSTILPRHRAGNCGRAGYEPLAGTSMATPHVTGVVALVVARFGKRRATPAFVYERLKSTADDLGLPGADPVYGYGRVNALRAVS